MLILLLKGYHIHGVVPLDTPSNWISIHPGISKKVVDSIIFSRRDREILKKLWDKLLKGKCSILLNSFFCCLLIYFVIPISLGYIFFGRFMLARTYLADARLRWLRIMRRRCPVGAIKMVNNRPWWTYKCESCMRCSNICPKKSVNSSVPLMAIYTILLLRCYKDRTYFS